LKKKRANQQEQKNYVSFQGVVVFFLCLTLALALLARDRLPAASATGAVAPKEYASPHLQTFSDSRIVAKRMLQ
jgi:hypothetical protein